MSSILGYDILRDVPAGTLHEISKTNKVDIKSAKRRNKEITLEALGWSTEQVKAGIEGECKDNHVYSIGVTPGHAGRIFVKVCLCDIYSLYLCLI